MVCECDYGRKFMMNGKSGESKKRGWRCRDGATSDDIGEQSETLDQGEARQMKDETGREEADYGTVLLF